GRLFGRGNTRARTVAVRPDAWQPGRGPPAATGGSEVRGRSGAAPDFAATWATTVGELGRDAVVTKPSSTHGTTLCPGDCGECTRMVGASPCFDTLRRFVTTSAGAVVRGSPPGGRHSPGAASSGR